MKEEIKSLIAKMTLEEKAALCSGVSMWDTTPIERLGIPSATMSDGPHGLRKEPVAAQFGNIFQKSIPATCFPPAVTLAATWNKALVRQVGEGLADECLEQEVGVLLGPGVNIKRNPLCGRNFEYFSEDPCLAGELGASYVEGVQSRGVGTSLKHFAVNSQETRRQISTSEVDERALREIYFPAFEKVVKRAQPATVMCSYNRINGVYASDNEWLLDDVLRREWGFKGIVVSDWGAVNDRIEGIAAGMDLEMPTSNGERDRMIVQAVEDGLLAESLLDEVVGRVLECVFRYSAVTAKHRGHKANYAANHSLARRAAGEGAVLLKNEQNLLPLTKGAKIAVVGQMAKHLRAQGTGSSKINPKNSVSFTEHLDSLKVRYDYARGYSLRKDEIDQGDIKHAQEVAKGKDAVLVFIGLTDAYEAEAVDRQHLDLPAAHNALVDAITSVNDNVIVVLSGGSPVVMPWADNVKAILNLYLPGEAGGEAAYDVLFGDVNPSGKLPESYPYALEDCISTPYFGKVVAEYRESIFVGYRFYDTAHRDVRFPFGHGLSYTQFQYSDLSVTQQDNGDHLVSFKLKNVGSHDGAEVVQIYVKNPKNGFLAPEKELRGFEKVFLKSGEEREITVKLTPRDFSYYSVAEKGWRIHGGTYAVWVGASSRDIRLMQKVELASTETLPVNYDGLYTYLHLDEGEGVSEIPKQEFERLLGRRVHVHHKRTKGKYDFNTVVGELDGSWFCRLFRWIFKKSSIKMLPKDAPYSERKMTMQGAMELPVRNFYAMSMGAVPYDACAALLAAFNGHVPWGLITLAKAFLKHRTRRKKKDIYKCKKS